MKKKEKTAESAQQQQPPASNAQRLTPDEFVLKAIDTLADYVKGTGIKRKTIHTVYSGFNQAFREYFPGQDPIKHVQKMVEEKKISFGMCRGGAMIALPGEINRRPDSKTTLGRMGLS